MTPDLVTRESLASKPAMLAALALEILPTRKAENEIIITAPELLADIAEARHFPHGFFAWARHWHFVNRESGALLTFAHMWAGQESFAQLMIDTAQRALELGDWLGIFALKAGKLGFTELECCWDGYVIFSRRNARVHLFSKEENAAKDMLGYVKNGLKRMPSPFGIRFLDSTLREIEAEKAGSQQFKLTVLNDGVQDFGDVRTVIAYATGKNPAIDQSCQHAHVDEWAHMEDPRQAWASIQSTIAPGGTGHIVTRGAGEHEDVERAWSAAIAGEGKLKSYFAPWHMRSDRDDRWYREQAATQPSLAALSHFAPETPEDAFRGDEDNDFVPVEVWDHCYDQYLVDNPLLPGSELAAICGADAASHRDIFALSLVTRHPLRPDDPACRMTKNWAPEDFADNLIDFATVQSFIRALCQGGCVLGHPQYEPWIGGKPCKPIKGQSWAPGECPACQAIADGHAEPVPKFNIYEFAYDRAQLEQMVQELKRDGVVWCREFPQASDRLSADRALRDLIVGRRFAHAGQQKLREHVVNAKSKTQKDEDSKIRIIKKAPHRRIDLLVATSMAVAECMRLNLQ